MRREEQFFSIILLIFASISGCSAFACYTYLDHVTYHLNQCNGPNPCCASVSSEYDSMNGVLVGFGVCFPDCQDNTRRYAKLNTHNSEVFEKTNGISFKELYPRLALEKLRSIEARVCIEDNCNRPASLDFYENFNSAPHGQINFYHWNVITDLCQKIFIPDMAQYELKFEWEKPPMQNFNLLPQPLPPPSPTEASTTEASTTEATTTEATTTEATTTEATTTEATTTEATTTEATTTEATTTEATTTEATTTEATTTEATTTEATTTEATTTEATTTEATTTEATTTEATTTEATTTEPTTTEPTTTEPTTTEPTTTEPTTTEPTTTDIIEPTTTKEFETTAFDEYKDYLVDVEWKSGFVKSINKSQILIALIVFLISLIHRF